MTVPTAPSGTETILIVDDDPIPLEFCRSVLIRAGYNVFSAMGGKQALDFFGKGSAPVDLALIDIVMPGMSGIELVKHLEGLAPKTRIVWMSGYAPDELKKLIGEQASRYRSIWKPFEPDSLVRMIRTVLDLPTEQKVLRQQANI
jgi:two-component system, cell cycle sensor histidine kinase and response regulator CckA